MMKIKSFAHAWAIVPLLVATPLLAQESAKPSTAKGESSWDLVFAAASGVGVFQDIQVPYNEYTGTRGDGTSATEENRDHMGLPLMGTLGIAMRFDRLTWDLALDLMQMRASTGPADTQSSSYNRINAGTGLRYKYRISDFTTYWGLHLQARRSTFNNVSSGHYLDTMMIRISAGMHLTKSWIVDGWFATAPYATFGYNNGGNRTAFKNSTSEVNEFGLLSSLRLHKNTWFDLGVEQEKATVTISDVEEYNNFGLNVSPSRQPSRLYTLSTSVIRAGFRKTF